MAKGTKYSQEFKEDAVRYRLEHPEMALRKCAENLGISESALKNWMKSAKNHEGAVTFHDLVIMHGRSGFLRTRLFVELF